LSYARLERRAADWAQRRQGTDPLGLTLRRRRIYILPTRFGAIFGALVFAMLLGSLNYGASLGFVLTFLLGSLALVAMHHCHNNLLGAHVQFAGARPVFAGEPAEFRIAIGNEADVPRYEIELARAGHTFGPVDVGPGESKTLRVGAPTERRGYVALERFAITTYHPGRLFRAWTWVHMDARCLVYPQPAPPGRPLPPSFQSGGFRGPPNRGDADFAGLRTAVPGDPPQHIAWKAYARSDQLLLKQFSTGDDQPHWLEWDTLPELDTEARLAQLTRWCLDAALEERSFGLRVPGTVVEIGNGQRHLEECLQVLALFGTAE
jgi:uncharacterized protein (DUF58 family)